MAVAALGPEAGPFSRISAGCGLPLVHGRLRPSAGDKQLA